MIPTLADASVWIWVGLAVAEFPPPIFLGLAIGLLPSIRLFFAGDRTRWQRFWMTTVAALWLTTAIVVTLMLQAGVTPAMVGVRIPGMQSLLFGFHHGGIKQGAGALFARAVIGFVFGLVAVRTGMLTVVIAIHYVFDAVLALRPSLEPATQAA